MFKIEESLQEIQKVNKCLNKQTKKQSNCVLGFKDII